MSQLVVPVSKSDHRRGPDGAPAVLLEYGDYECPWCARAHFVVEAVRQRLGPRVQFVFRNFPLTTIHPHAELAAEGAEAASEQGRFWEMHDALFENQQRLGSEFVARRAQALGLDIERFIRELNEGVYRERVRQDFRGGVRSGVNGTPTFFINGMRYDLPFDEVTLTAALQQVAREPIHHARHHG